MLLVTAVVRPAAQWYVSDEHGVLGEQIAQEASGEHEYVIRVDRSAATEIRTLYHDQEALQRTELEYAGDRLAARRVREGDEVVLTEHFRYWADGSLRTVRRVGESGAVAEFRYRDGRLDEEWTIAASSDEVVRYDEAGRVSARVSREDGRVVETERREYWGADPGAAVREIVIVADGLETVRRYDESGRLLGTSTAREGSVESDRVRVFEDGLLVEERETAGGVTRVWRYAYEGEELVEVRYLEDDVLVMRTEYDPSGTTRMERIYRSGEEALRVHYRGEDRVREEVIRGGEIIRTRTFETPGTDGGSAS